jgi:hypothetical protein
MRKAAGKSFRQWVLDVYGPKASVGDQTSLSRKYTHRMDCILRFESLEDDLIRIGGQIGLPKDFSLPVKNRTAGRDAPNYQSYYDQETKQIIAQCFANEINSLGYIF